MRKLALLTILLLLATALAAQGGMFAPAGRKACLGLGWGIPYGGLGGSADILFLDNVALTAGFGANQYTAGYALGLKYLHGKPDRTWRPQALLVYGINGVVAKDETLGMNANEAYSGLTAGLGSQFMFGKHKRHGFDVDLIYVISSGVFKRCDELGLKDPSRFTYSLGYRYAFDLKF